MICKKKPSLGFTLIELLIVIAIIGFLLAMYLLLLNPFDKQQKARDSVRKSDLVLLNKAIGQYYLSNQELGVPTGLGCQASDEEYASENGGCPADICCVSFSDRDDLTTLEKENAKTSGWLANSEQYDLADYVPRIPVDPLNGNQKGNATYRYKYAASYKGQNKFMLGALLENTQEIFSVGTQNNMLQTDPEAW